MHLRPEHPVPYPGAVASGLEVRTTSGAVRGVALRGGAGGLHAWRGVPYAASTAGEGRFRAPRPPEPWPGVRDASAFGPVAPQTRSRIPIAGNAATGWPMGEDCLAVSVVAPAAPAAPRPVMVWIHGGSFLIGSASVPGYGGEALVRAGDVVHVAVNYRLGALGFLDFTRYSTPQRPIEANLGIRDVVAALEWVRDNIAAFGGDPGNVTVYGESAGGIAVTTLLAVPAARGLFHRAIAQSSAPATAYGPVRSAGWAAQFVGLLGAEESDAAAALLAADPDTLVRAASTLDGWANETTPGVLCFAPVVDGEFLPVHPVDAAATGATHAVPLLIGTNAQEATFFARTGSNALPTTPARVDRLFASTDPPARERVLAAYPGYPGRAAVEQVAGDHGFWWSSVRVAEGHSRTAPTFMYRYDLAPPLARLTGFGATHVAELVPVLGWTDAVPGRLLTALGGRAALRAAGARMQEHWTHFARHGTPSPDVGAPGWPAYDPEHRRTLVIDATDRVESDPHADRRRAWDGFADYR